MEPRKTSGRQGADLAKAEIVVADAGNLVKDTFYPREIRKNHFLKILLYKPERLGIFLSVARRNSQHRTTI
jgi:hypothetical protein